MKLIIIFTKVHGFEIYQVYNENGYQGQRWSRGAAEQLAAKVLREANR